MPVGSSAVIWNVAWVLSGVPRGVNGCELGRENPVYWRFLCVIRLRLQSAIKSSFDALFLCIFSRVSQRFAAAGWEVLHDHMCRGRQLTEPGRGRRPLDIGQHLSWSGFVRRMTDARDSSDERALHLAWEPGLRPGGSDRPQWSGVDCLPSNPWCWARVMCSERPIVPRNREVENCQTGTHLAAKRSAFLSCKSTELARLVFRHPLSLSGVKCADDVWVPGAGRSAARGLWFSPDDSGVACIPSTSPCYIGVSKRKRCSRP